MEFVETLSSKCLKSRLTLTVEQPQKSQQSSNKPARVLKLEGSNR